MKQFHRHIPSGEYIRVFFLRFIGNFLIISSLFVIAKTFYQPLKEEVRYFVEQQFRKEYVVAAPQEALKVEEDTKAVEKGAFAQAFNVDPVEVLVPIDPDFSIVIPKIAANAQVLPNVNVADENIYLEALRKGVAHAEGTAFPGEGGHIFLFAHSTDYIWNVGTYNAVFYLLYKLEEGDEVNVFYKGQRHRYKVTGKQVVNPDEVEYLTRKTPTEVLTMQTCWPPGTTLQRMLIFAEPITN
ncbi:MAG: sortase [Weeksellaceae bacterium]